MIIQTPVCPYLVTVARSALNTHDVDEISDWIGQNLTGAFMVINFGKTIDLSMGGTDLPTTDTDPADALFCFAVYEDALHFQMRFIG